MKKLFSILWKVLGVAALCVVVYLIVQVFGESQSVIGQYEQLTGNSIGAVNSVKIAFLRDYIQHTGNTDILLTLGVSGQEAQLIVADDLIPDNLAEPDDETQTPGPDQEDPVNNPTPQPGSGGGNSGGGNSGGGGSGGTGGGSGSGGGNSGGSSGGGTTGGSTGGTSGSSPGFMKQGDAVVAQVIGDTDTIASGGCGIVALYNAYYANSSNPVSLRDVLLRYSNEKLGGNGVRVDQNGNLQGRVGSLAQGAALWNWMCSTYFNPGGATEVGNKTVDQAIQQDGKYIVYYKHADSGQHWVYAVRSGNSWTVQNAARKEGANIGGRTCIRYYKIS